MFLRNLEILVLKIRDYVQVIIWVHQPKVGMQCLIWQKWNLNLLDPVMYIFFEKGMRVGVSYIFNKNSKANNKYLKSYDQKHDAINLSA